MDFQSLGKTAEASEREMIECISEAKRTEIEDKIREYEAGLDKSLHSSAVGPEPYPFFPHAGTVWQDLYLRNFVDLDPSPGILDWACTGLTYNGHTGVDSGLRSFREQDIGVPVFAALDGTVVEVNDGAFDRNTSCQPNAPVNYVILHHGNGHTSWYLHLRKGSVAVRLSQFVKAGTQLGLTGSSGCSTGPHLHFESRYANVTYEPFSGRCRPGPSYWVNQLSIQREMYARDISFSATPFTGLADFPFDQGVRVNTFLPGFQRIFFKTEIDNVAPFSPYTIAIRRPNGTDAGHISGTIGSSFIPVAWLWWYFDLNLDAIGTWLVTLVIGPFYVEAYFNVVASSGQIVNHRPLSITTGFDPARPNATDVIFCRVNTFLPYKDPDYDIVSYRYRWSVNGVLVRDVTTSALSDAIPKGTAGAGDRVACTVEPYDGKAFGPSSTSSVAIPGVAVPSISSVDFDGKKKLSISGQLFGSSPTVLINSVNITDYLRSSSDTFLKLKGKTAALGLRSGNNSIQVVNASGAGSNVYILRL